MKNEFIEKFYNTIISGFDSDEIQKQKFEEIIKSVKAITPSSLFRYRKITDYTLSDLDNDIISLSYPSSFNDPYDSLIKADKQKFIENVLNVNNKDKIINLIEKTPEILNKLNLNKENKEQLVTYINKLKSVPNEEIKQLLLSAQNVIDSIFNSAWKDVFIYLKSTPRIACFSEDVSSNVMWAHYADSHKGFVIEYNFNDYINLCTTCQKQCPNRHNESLYPVKYSDERFDVTPLLIYSANLFLMKQFLKEGTVLSDDQLVIYKALLSKSTNWSYEKEWRLISLSDNPRCTEQIKLKPKAIYLGIDISSINSKILKYLAKGKNIPVYQMNIDIESTDYKMNYIKIVEA